MGLWDIPPLAHGVFEEGNRGCGEGCAEGVRVRLLALAYPDSLNAGGECGSAVAARLRQVQRGPQGRDFGLGTTSHVSPFSA